MKKHSHKRNINISTHLKHRQTFEARPIRAHDRVFSDFLSQYNSPKCWVGRLRLNKRWSNIEQPSEATITLSFRSKVLRNVGTFVLF